MSEDGRSAIVAPSPALGGRLTLRLDVRGAGEDHTEVIGKDTE